MKKNIIALMAACGLIAAEQPLDAYSEDTEMSTQSIFNEYISMTNEEVLSIYNTDKLTECGFGDETISDSVKFEKYLNTPPDFYIGDNYCSSGYAAYKRFISGEAEPYITFYVDMGISFSDKISSEDLGYPADWRIESVNGKMAIEYKVVKPIHEYRLYVPVDIIEDFETYIRLEASNHHFTDIENDNKYGIYYCADIDSQFASYGEAEAIIDGNLAGDANLDGKTTVADAVAILQNIANRDKYGLKEQGLINADIDGEAGVTANDALTLQKWDANK